MRGRDMTIMPVFWGIACAAAAYGFVLFANWWHVQPSGSNSLIGLAPVLWLLMLLGLPVLAFALVLEFRARKSHAAKIRTQLIAVTAAFVVMIALQLAASPLRLGWQIRRRAYEAFAQRSAPLVAAIGAYQAKHGTPPDRLQDLVPEFLHALPETGLPQGYVYENRTRSRARYAMEPDDRHHGNPWILTFSTFSAMQFDTLFYYPLGNYPETNASGSIEKIADWAYCHE